MSSTDQRLRRIPFPAVAAGQSFIEQMNATMRARVDELMSGMIPKENTEVFYHGRTFVYRQEDLSSHEITMETHAAEHELELVSVLAAVQEKRQEQTADACRPYQIERATPVFTRPGPKKPRVGYAYKGTTNLCAGDHRALDFHPVRRPFQTGATSRLDSQELHDSGEVKPFPLKTRGLLLIYKGCVFLSGIMPESTGF